MKYGAWGTVADQHYAHEEREIEHPRSSYRKSKKASLDGFRQRIQVSVNVKVKRADRAQPSADPFVAAFMNHPLEQA